MKEHWVYDVTVENKTFAALKDVEVKYVVYFTKEQLGVKAAPSERRQPGSIKVPSLLPHEKKVLNTEPVEITKARLDSNYYYPSGAKASANDVLLGLRVRIMRNGQQFAEWANPTTLLREKWE